MQLVSDHDMHLLGVEIFLPTCFVSCNGPCAPKEKWHRKEHVLLLLLLLPLLYDVVHPEAVLYFTPTYKKDEYFYQQLFMHKRSLRKVWK